MNEMLLVPIPGSKKRGAIQWTRREKVPCTITDVYGQRGSKHEYESWGPDVVHQGNGYFEEVEVLVCINPDCMRSKAKALPWFG